MRLYRFLKPIVRVLCAFIIRLRIKKPAIELPDGPVVICCNHVHALDPIVLAFAVKRPIHFMSKKELFAKKWLAKLITVLGAYPVDRQGNDIKSIKHFMGLLKENKVVGLYPEGTRSRDGQVHAFHGGGAMLALRTGASIVPAAVSGNWKFMSRVSLVLGEPLDLSKYSGRKATQEDIQAVTEKLEQTVKELYEQAKELK